MKLAIITGAAQGIGRRTAEIFAVAGYSLALLDLQPCTATLSSIRAIGCEAMDFPGDISDESVVEAAAEAIRERWNRVDVLVNNAGISSIARAETVDVKTFRRVLEVNLVAPFLLARTFGKVMLQQRSGCIVNVASIAGLAGIADRAAYNASKHGLIGLTRTLASEWGGRGVRCNAVCPGWVKTEMDQADQANGKLHRRRHHRSQSDGPLCPAGRHRPRHPLPRRPRAKRIYQRPSSPHRRRLDHRRQLAKPAPDCHR